MNMAKSEFYRETSRRRVIEAVGRAEAQTSAEIVVALRRASTSVRPHALCFGAACGFVTLVVLLVVPTPLARSAFVLDVALVSALAAWAVRLFPDLLRAMIPRDERARNVKSAASALFLKRGVHRCKGRNGVLVYVSMLERLVEVVGDVGVDHGTLEHARARANEALAAGDVEAFAGVIEAIGQELSDVHPRGADDVNELPDEA